MSDIKEKILDMIEQTILTDDDAEAREKAMTLAKDIIAAKSKKIAGEIRASAQKTDE